MALKKTSHGCMKDISPEMEIRDYVIRMIKDTYGSLDFHPSKHPAWNTLKICPASRAAKTKS